MAGNSLANKNLNSLESASLARQLNYLKERIAKLEQLLNGQPVGTARIRDAAITNAKIDSLEWDKGQGGTLTLGGTSNGNGEMTVLDNSNVEKIHLDNDGIAIYDGKLYIENEDGFVSIDPKGIVSSQNFTKSEVASAFTGSTLQTITGSGGSAVVNDISGATLSFTLDRDCFVSFRAKSIMSIGFSLTNHTNVRGTLYMDLNGTDVDQSWAEGRRRTSPADDVYGNVGNFLTMDTMYGAFLAAGSHTIKLKGRIHRVSGATTDAQLFIFSYYLEYVIFGT